MNTPQSSKKLESPDAEGDLTRVAKSCGRQKSKTDVKIVGVKMIGTLFDLVGNDTVLCDKSEGCVNYFWA